MDWHRAARVLRRASDWADQRAYDAARRERHLSGMAGRVVSTPGVVGGVPRLDGTRIDVATIQALLASGFDVSEVLAMYPPLVAADVEACRVDRLGDRR